MIGAREMNVQLPTRGMERADTAASGTLALQSKGQHGDKGSWLQGGGIRRRQGFGGRGGSQNTSFLRNEAICNVEENASILVGEKGLCRLQKNDK